MLWSFSTCGKGIRRLIQLCIGCLLGAEDYYRGVWGLHRLSLEKLLQATLCGIHFAVSSKTDVCSRLLKANGSVYKI